MFLEYSRFCSYSFITIVYLINCMDVSVTHIKLITVEIDVESIEMMAVHFTDTDE